MENEFVFNPYTITVSALLLLLFAAIIRFQGRIYRYVVISSKEMTDKKQRVLRKLFSFPVSILGSIIITGSMLILFGKSFYKSEIVIASFPFLTMAFLSVISVSLFILSAIGSFRTKWSADKDETPENERSILLKDKNFYRYFLDLFIAAMVSAIILEAIILFNIASIAIAVGTAALYAILYLLISQEIISHHLPTISSWSLFWKSRSNIDEQIFKITLIDVMREGDKEYLEE